MKDLNFKNDNDLDINIPPNFNLYAEQEEWVDKENALFEERPRLGESNPMTFPCKRSQQINFQGLEMEKLTLESVLNPYQKDMKNVNKELENYRDRVQRQNQELERLQQEREFLVSQSQYQQGYDIDEIRKEKEAIKSMLQQQNFTNTVDKYDDFFDSNKNIQVKSEIPRNKPKYGGNFFDVKETIQIVQPQQQYNTLTNPQFISGVK